MEIITAIHTYRKNHGEKDIIDYYNSHGTYRGIVAYLSECNIRRDSQNDKSKHCCLEYV